MAQTQSGKKRVFVHGHSRQDGSKVPPHYPTPPCPTPTSKPKK